MEPVAIASPGSEVWTPSDVTPPSYQPTSLRNGLVYSKNTITAQVMQKVGAKSVGALAQAMGVRQSKLDLVPSLALKLGPLSDCVLASTRSSNRLIEDRKFEHGAELNWLCIT